MKQSYADHYDINMLTRTMKNAKLMSCAICPHFYPTYKSTVNTRVYNDQKSFREFCYGTMKSCKEEDADQCSKDFRKVGPHFY